MITITSMTRERAFAACAAGRQGPLYRLLLTEGQAHLAAVVAAAENRLGLPPCDHPRVEVSRCESWDWFQKSCLVCQRVVATLSDEAILRFTARAGDDERLLALFGQQG